MCFNKLNTNPENQDKSIYSLRISDLIPFAGFKNYGQRTKSYEEETFEWLSSRSIKFSKKKFNREMFLVLYNAALFSSAGLGGLVYLLSNN